MDVIIPLSHHSPEVNQFRLIRQMDQAISRALSTAIKEARSYVYIHVHYADVDY